VTEGLDGLRDRIAAYRALGARFAKWRAVLSIADGRPSRRAVVANAHALARYAALCQEGGLVPIVEPEVLTAGDHDIGRCHDATGDVLTEVFAQLQVAEVDLAAIVLKPSMIQPGTDAPSVSVDTVAAASVDCLRATVPDTVPGIAFLSGGQSPSSATEHLAAMVALGPHPWPLTFSYGRAQFRQTFNDIGNEGWELVSYQAVPMTGGINTAEKIYGYAYLAMCWRNRKLPSLILGSPAPKRPANPFDSASSRETLAEAHATRRDDPQPVRSRSVPRPPRDPTRGETDLRPFAGSIAGVGQ